MLHSDSVLSDALFIPKNYRYEKVVKSDILFLAANGAYVDLVTLENMYRISTNLGVIAEQLTGAEFVKVSRSHVVNLHHIDAIQGNRVYIQDYQIVISKQFRQGLLNHLPIVRTKYK